MGDTNEPPVKQSQEIKKGWRPEGWVTLKPKNEVLHCFAPAFCVGESFEAGADAMLEALIKGGLIAL